jgi:hypothetical protein
LPAICPQLPRMMNKIQKYDKIDANEDYMKKKRAYRRDVV